MTINFYKYQGAGNDFILIDHRDSQIKNIDNSLVAQLCDRRFGIGADGLMLLTQHPDYDFEMIYYNADGNVGSMCGNGGRCIVAFAKHFRIIDSETNFLAVDGPHYAKISAEGNWVELQMIDVDSITNDGEAFVLNTGSPHYIEMVDSINSVDVFGLGQMIRFNDRFKLEGINVNFVQQQDDKIFVRTYERGVENETFSCGTGVTAAAITTHLHKTGEHTVAIKTLGGELAVRFNHLGGGHFNHIWLQGPGTFVYKANIHLK